MQSKDVLRWLKWLWNFWPFIVNGMICVVVLLMIKRFPGNESLIKNIVVNVPQVSGVVIVLLSVNGNYLALKRQNLFQVYKSILQDCPIFTKGVVIDVPAAMLSVDERRVSVRAGMEPKNIDETVEYLQKQINTLFDEIDIERREREKNLLKVSKKYDHKIENLMSEFQAITSSVESISLGVVDWQIFGALLVLQGVLDGLLL
jgi:hypothetical protein